jgi:hypothetical protein
VDPAGAPEAGPRFCTAETASTCGQFDFSRKNGRRAVRPTTAAEKTVDLESAP